MGVLFKIVYRNLMEHKVKSLIIGIIIAFGMYILIVGNSVIDTVTAGISKNFIEYNTGHIAVFPSSLEEPSLVGGGPEMMENKVVPIIRDYRSVVETVRSDPAVTAVSPQINGMVTMQFGEEGSGFAQLLAVDPELYVNFFPDNIVLEKGRFLQPGEEGIVLSASTVEMLEDSSGETVDLGDPVILTGTTPTSGMKIREVPVVGIYDVTVASQLMTSYLDVENMRVLNGMTQITDLEAALTKDEQSDLGAVDEGSLFGGGDSFIIEETEETAVVSGAGKALSLPDSTAEKERFNAVDPDAWHYLLVRLEDESQIRNTVRGLNTEFAARDLDVTAYSWIDAAGQVAEMTTALRIVFNIIIIIIAVVAVIIIMNTLVISVTERIGEIGTMRAIGAQKSFVRRMIILETVIISLFFGGLGILLGSLTIGIVRAAGIETQSLILQMLAGGAVIKPIISAGSIVVSLVGMLVAGIIASLYPAQLALRIEPRQAMDAH